MYYPVFQWDDITDEELKNCTTCCRCVYMPWIWMVLARSSTWFFFQCLLYKVRVSCITVPPNFWPVISLTLTNLTCRHHHHFYLRGFCYTSSYTQYISKFKLRRMFILCCCVFVTGINESRQETCYSSQENIECVYSAIEGKFK